MTINETLARYSDWSFESAFAIYALATVLLIARYASMRARAVQDRELVAAGATGGSVATADLVPGRVVEKHGKTWSEKFGGMGYALLGVGAVLHIASIVLRGFATERFPLGNMYEFVTMACAAAIVAGLVALRKTADLWVFMLVPVLILMFLAATVLYADAAPVVPALRSFWLPIHVTIISVSSGIFLVSGVASILFLYRMKFPAGEEGDGPFGKIAQRLPNAETLDRLAYKSTIVAFPLFGAGIILARSGPRRPGTLLGWDPKETVSFIAWVIYAAYLHARATSGWRDTKAAWINVAGFVAMLFNLFIINMVVSGLHSYAGLT
ncbi:c-type cytochrome biogenesis protein CcsB [Rhodococcus hoagii]|nr:c-type cytochrome biogenesis protein CcsB [Prescottella equi]